MSAPVGRVPRNEPDMLGILEDHCEHGEDYDLCPEDCEPPRLVGRVPLTDEQLAEWAQWAVTSQSRPGKRESVVSIAARGAMADLIAELRASRAREAHHIEALAELNDVITDLTRESDEQEAELLVLRPALRAAKGRIEQQRADLATAYEQLHNAEQRIGEALAEIDTDRRCVDMRYGRVRRVRAALTGTEDARAGFESADG